jgi:hypothetical protein
MPTISTATPLSAHFLVVMMPSKDHLINRTRIPLRFQIPVDKPIDIHSMGFPYLIPEMASAEAWVDAFLNRQVVRAHGPRGGVGIWALGDTADRFVCTLAQQLFRVTQWSKHLTMTYVTAYEFIEDAKPESSDAFQEDARKSLVTIIGNYSPSYASDWGRNQIAELIITRFNAGLPTLVSATSHPMGSIPAEAFIPLTASSKATMR